MARSRPWPWIVVTGTLGAYLARRQGLGALRRAEEEMAAGRLPAAPIMDGIIILIAGAVLMTPGVLTDAFGFLCLIPPCRQPPRRCGVGSVEQTPQDPAHARVSRSEFDPKDTDRVSFDQMSKMSGLPSAGQCHVDYAALGGLFSSTVIQELARRGRSRTLSRHVGESGLASALRPHQTLREAFELAFHYLSHCHRTEYVYKDAIANRVLVGRHSLNTAVMLSELRVGPCKADAVILNGTSTAYEIKSDRDRLDRLRTQANTYLHSFARVVVVASDRHVAEVLKTAPQAVGVMRLTSRGYLSTEREPLEDPSRIKPAILFEALQLREASQVLRMLGVDVPDVPNTLQYRVHLDLFRQLASVDAHAAMIDVLRTTRSQRRLTPLFAAVPPSLRAALVSTPLRQADHERLLSSLGTSMTEVTAWN